jgi:ATP phosphoribosyltransferase regulatory subunit
MSESLSKIPDGMRYYFGAEARLRRSIEDAVMGVFDGWSYEEITTPAVDYLALFERGLGHEAANRAFRFTDGDGLLLALRPDVTSSVARAAATLFAESQRPLRLCYAAPVFRQQQPSRAEWRRESKQLGCEFIGPGARFADLEMLAIATEILERLGLRDSYRITINSVEVFNGVAERLALGAPARDLMRHLIDIRDAAELQRFLSAYETDAADCAAFSRLTELPGKREVLTRARRVITNERSRAALAALEELWLTIERLDLADAFEMDLGDVSGLDYYTGLTFKIYVAGTGARVGGGGRYDRLTANFGRAEPAVGFVLDLDALTEVLMRNESRALDSNRDSSAAPLLDEDAGRLFLEARRRRSRRERVRIERKEGNGCLS